MDLLLELRRVKSRELEFDHFASVLFSPASLNEKRRHMPF